MNKFLKPTLIKIILTVFLLCLAFFSRLYLTFPLNSVYFPPFQCPKGAVCNSPAPQLNLLIFIFNHVFNLIFSYLIACFLVWVWQKFKQFLKPDWRKIVLTIILMAAKYFYVSKFNGIYVYLITDIIIWYFVSCLIIWIYDKIKKKPS